jgi:hypothetical protein
MNLFDKPSLKRFRIYSYAKSQNYVFTPDLRALAITSVPFVSVSWLSIAIRIAPNYLI